MSNIYTKEQLEKRGWTEEKIEVLLYKPYKEVDEIGWNRKQIRKIEKYDEYIKFTKNGKSVLIGGMSDYPYYEFYTPDDDVPSRTLWEEFAEKAKNNFTILLHHQPEYIAEDAKKTDIDLIVCGHTHGGQIQLPFIGGVIAPNQGLFPKYDKGEFDLDGTKMIVCAGLSNTVFIPRINNQVEIGVVTVV